MYFVVYFTFFFFMFFSFSHHFLNADKIAELESMILLTNESGSKSDRVSGLTTVGKDGATNGVNAAKKSRFMCRISISTARILAKSIGVDFDLYFDE